MSFTITPGAGAAVTITPVPGTLTFGDGQDDRGGRVTPIVRAGLARNGSCQTILTALNRADIIALVSPAGVGDRDIAGDDIPASADSYDALVDIVEGEGEDGVEVATITWKGTTAEASSGE